MNLKNGMKKLIQIKYIGATCKNCFRGKYHFKTKRAIVGNYNCLNKCGNYWFKIGNIIICKFWKYV